MRRTFQRCGVHQTRTSDNNDRRSRREEESNPRQLDGVGASRWRQRACWYRSFCGRRLRPRAEPRCHRHGRDMAFGRGQLSALGMLLGDLLWEAYPSRWRREGPNSAAVERPISHRLPERRSGRSGGGMAHSFHCHRYRSGGCLSSLLTRGHVPEVADMLRAGKIHPKHEPKNRLQNAPSGLCLGLFALAQLHGFPDATADEITARD